MTTAAGLVIAARSMVTKRGNKMGIFTLDDRSGRLDVTLFSEALEKYEELMQKTVFWWFLDRSALMTSPVALKCRPVNYWISTMRESVLPGRSASLSMNSRLMIVFPAFVRDFGTRPCRSLSGSGKLSSPRLPGAIDARYRVAGDAHRSTDR